MQPWVFAMHEADRTAGSWQPQHAGYSDIQGATFNPNPDQKPDCNTKYARHGPLATYLSNNLTLTLTTLAFKELASSPTQTLTLTLLTATSSIY